MRDRFSSEYLAATAAATLDTLAKLRRNADEAGKRLQTLALETEVRFASPEQQADFARELTESLAELVRRYHNDTAPEGRRFRFTIGGHPALRPLHPKF